MVAALGTSQPSFTYKTGSLLQAAHKSLQKKARRDTTILPHASQINNLRDHHTSSASNQKYTNQFVASESPTRARPTSALGLSDELNNDNAFEVDLGCTLESPAELNRRVFAGSRKRRQKKHSAPRCRRCGKHWNLDPWKDLHKRPNSEIERNSNSNGRPQTRYLRHGEGHQVWDHCRVAENDYEEGFPCLDLNKPLM
jgi:hypothetical protein